MKTILFTFLALISFINSYCQETYYIGKTEYYNNQYYSTTGKPVVKRSETNKKEFLKSQGYKSIPNGYQIDHIKPLSEGGTDEPTNMQLLTISQHQEKTSRERTNRSTSNYLATKPNYKYSITTNEYGERISFTTYSRTDLNGRIIYINSNGNEFYFNDNERKIYVKNSSNVENSKYHSPTKKSSDYNHNTTETISQTRLYESSPSLPTISTPSIETSTSREIITGPRGGQYYINSNGNKTYVPR